MLDERGVVGISVLLAMIVCFASQDVGADLGERVKDRHVAANRLLQSFGRGVDLRERAWCALDGADDGLDMRMLLRGGENGIGVVAEGLFQSGIRRGRDDGIEISARGDLGEIQRGCVKRS